MRKADTNSIRVVRHRADGTETRPNHVLTNSSQPLSKMFSTTPTGAPNPFAMSKPPQPQSPRLQIAEDKPQPQISLSDSSAKPAVVHPPHQVESRAPTSLADSGYHGSQSQDTLPFDHFEKEDIEMADSPPRDQPTSDPVFPPPSEPARKRSPSVASADETFESANENQTRQPTTYVTANMAPTPSSAMVQDSSPFAARTRLPILSPRSPSPNKMSSPIRDAPQNPSSPEKSTSPQKPSSSPQRSGAVSQQKGFPKPTEDLGDAASGRGRGAEDEAMEDEEADGARSPSDTSSPIRPLVRKSSLNFASLPAREPLASKKSLGGARISRTSHLDFSRQSYYNRPTGGKSLGTGMRQESSDDERDDHDEMDVDDEPPAQKEDTSAHSKTYTQRLQDQISMLGKGQSMGPRPSKSLANSLPSQQGAQASQQSQPRLEAAPEVRKASPKPKHSVPAPGAFPEDDDDDWIAPPATAAAPPSPKPAPARAPANARHSGDVEDVFSKGAPRSPEFVLPKSRQGSPRKLPFMPERTPKHGKSVSVPVLPTLEQLNVDPEGAPLTKTVSVSNPTLSSVAEDEFTSSPPKSPTRSFRENPLKQVKNKLSSLLKGSKGLIASSAAISAEGKSSLLQSPSTTRLGYFAGPSVDSFKTADNVMYPDLSQQTAAIGAPLSPTRSNATRRTRASAERERQEAKEREREEKEREKEREKEAKEAKRLADQMEKLEKAREKEREKARVFSKEQEKIAAMEKQVAAQRQQDKVAQAPAQAQSQDFRTPAPAPKNTLRSPVKAVRATPLKTKASQQDSKNAAALSDELDMEMTDVTTTVPPASIPRPTTASSMRAPGIKRPMKPTKETLSKSKQAPTLIRVNTTSSQQQQNQFHPSNSVLAATLQETLGQQPSSTKQMNGKASQGSLHRKPSLQSLKTSVSSTGRPKALEMAAKRKEQEERDAQRKRDAKLELERKRAAQEEERKQEQQRKADAERQKEEERKAAIEKAKQTKAPPPAARPQPNGPPEYSMAAEKAPTRPPSRLGSTMHQDSRLVNTALSSTAKAAGPAKRPLQQDAGEESSRAPQQQRALPSFPAKEAKRMRMSEEFDEDLDMMDSHNPRIIKGPPVRPSGGLFKKVSRRTVQAKNPTQHANPPTQELPTAKSMYGNAYSNAPPAAPPSASRDLFKATVTAQHNSHTKTGGGHPLDMAQLSKGTIPFAQNPSTAKTPARPGPGGAMPKSSAAKSAAARSPRFQNGESIELPDIQTDDESDDDDGGHMAVAAWADSPALKAALLAQERVDPMQVFGPPAPLNMEEVFSKTKDRWHKFRARTSSANWSGTDRLTEEDVRRDLAARDKMRREGGWSYEVGRE